MGGLMQMIAYGILDLEYGDIIVNRQHDYYINDCIKSIKNISFRKYKNYLIEKLEFYSYGNSSFTEEQGLKLITKYNSGVKYMNVNFMKQINLKNENNIVSRENNKLTKMILEQIKLSSELNEECKKNVEKNEISIEKEKIKKGKGKGKVRDKKYAPRHNKRFYYGK